MIKVGSAVIRASNATARNRAWDPPGVQLTEFLPSFHRLTRSLRPYLPPPLSPLLHPADDISKSGKFLENATVQITITDDNS